jgi:hypothetical protein
MTFGYLFYFRIAIKMHSYLCHPERRSLPRRISTIVVEALRYAQSDIAQNNTEEREAHGRYAANLPLGLSQGR